MKNERLQWNNRTWENTPFWFIHWFLSFTERSDELRKRLGTRPQSPESEVISYGLFLCYAHWAPEGAGPRWVCSRAEWPTLWKVSSPVNWFIRGIETLREWRRKMDETNQILFAPGGAGKRNNNQKFVLFFKNFFQRIFLIWTIFWGSFFFFFFEALLFLKLFNSVLAYSWLTMLW